MNTYIITYVLKTPGQKYKEIEEHLGDVLNGKKILNTVWLVSSSFSAVKLKEALMVFDIDDNDSLFIARLHEPRSIAKYRLNAGSTDWIDANM